MAFCWLIESVFFYEKHVEMIMLKGELAHMREKIISDADTPPKSFHDIEVLLQSKNVRELEETCDGAPSAMTLINALCANPATTATPERTFSKMKMIESYLRNQMSYERFRRLSALNFYPDEVDGLDLAGIANKLASARDERVSALGKFSYEDVKWFENIEQALDDAMPNTKKNTMQQHSQDKKCAN